MNQLDYTPPRHQSLSTAIRFWLVTVMGAWALLILYGILDFLMVRLPHLYLDCFDYAWIPSPLLIGTLMFYVLRDRHVGMRIFLSILGMIIGMIITAALIAFLGVPFHFAIGGSL